MRIKLILIICFALQVPVLFSQLILHNPPKDNAFISRNVLTNAATITLKGQVDDTFFSSLQVKIYRNHILISSAQVPLKALKDHATFTYEVNLEAGKYIYTIEYLVSNSKGNYTKTIDGIVIGDAYLIQGQSNAVAANHDKLGIKYSKEYVDTFIRSFGNSTCDLNIVHGDTSWYSAENTNHSWIGEWGLVLAKTLLDSFGIPICILNGALGGTTITQHTSTYNNPIDINSIYGRLLYRARKASIDNNIRGIFYFQGESDGSNARLHDSLFRQIYTSWNRDYKGFEKLYFVQVRGQSCGAPSIQLRDYQRRFEYSLSRCKVISSNGLNNHDGCHYGFVNGYEQLGLQLAALVSRDLYHGRITRNIDPPNIKNCFYSNADGDEITINMNNPKDIIYSDPDFYKLFNVEGDSTVSIVKGFIRHNCVILKLDHGSYNITGLTYDSGAGMQPWIKNSLNMGLISFYNVPIEPYGY